jgi:hypothetical protein
MRAIVLSITLFFHSLLAAQYTIKVFTTDQVRNLNPFMCQSQIEFALQEIVFPPLVDNFRIKSEHRSEFRELIIGQGACQLSGVNPYEVMIAATDLPVTLQSLEKNFKAIRSLGSSSPFSWNYGTVFKDDQGNIKITFRKAGKARHQGCSIPMVNFDEVTWPTDSSGLIIYNTSFQSRDSGKYLQGYPLYGDTHGYSYSTIELNNQMVTLQSGKEQSPRIHVIGLPTYQNFIKQLTTQTSRDGIVGINISPLTTNLRDLRFYDQGFTHNYVKLMRLTQRGLTRRDNTSGIGIEDLRYIRSKYSELYRQHSLFGKIHSVVRVAGFTKIPLRSASPQEEIKREGSPLTLQYVKDDLTEELVGILSNIFREIGLNLTAQETLQIDEKAADIIIESVYLYDPGFLNVRYYEEWNQYYSRDPGSRGTRIWGGSIVTGSINNCIQEENLGKYEESMLNSLPVVFLYQYAPRIGYRNVEPNRNRTVNGQGQVITGTPFFFYNVINWSE